MSALSDTAEYKVWLEERLGVPVDVRGLQPGEYEYYKNSPDVQRIDLEESTLYESTSERLLTQFRDSDFWKRIKTELVNADFEYRRETGNRFCLLAHPISSLDVDRKPWKSVVDKAYRKNRRSHPGSPNTVWVTPDNWLVTLRDVIRTTIVVRYLDCFERVGALIEEVAADVGVTYDSPDYEAREEGYYAVHWTILFPFRFPTQVLRSPVEVLQIPVEIQLCTQVQEVLRALTHIFYEERRGRSPSSTDPKWQWDSQCPQFVPNYLGHLLHYADGAIMNIRHGRSASE